MLLEACMHLIVWSIVVFKKDSQCIPILFGIQRTCLLCSAKENKQHTGLQVHKGVSEE